MTSERPVGTGIAAAIVLRLRRRACLQRVLGRRERPQQRVSTGQQIHPAWFVYDDGGTGEQWHPELLEDALLHLEDLAIGGQQVAEVAAGGIRLVRHQYGERDCASHPAEQLPPSEG